MRVLESLLAAAPLLAVAAAPAAADVNLINVEVDYMVGFGHDHEPSQDLLDALVQMFACQGITLNLLVSDAIPEITVMEPTTITGTNFFTGVGPKSFVNLKQQYSQTKSLPTWHYCIIGHDYDNGEGTGSGGLGEVGGDDFVVTFGSWNGGAGGTDYQVASGFAHELGHNLGLQHYSPASSNVTGDYAPNYASIMSYQYAVEGVKSQMECLGLVGPEHAFRDLDFSHGLLPPLVESNLNEQVGVGISRMDWDCNGVASSSVNRELDLDWEFCQTGTGLSILRDWDDWNQIKASANVGGVSTGAEEGPYSTCITWREVEERRAARLALVAAGLADPSLCTAVLPVLDPTAGCSGGGMVWVDASATGTQNGTGWAPWQTFGGAWFVTPSGSSMYLQPSTLTNGGNPLVLDRPMILTGPGGAVIDP